MHDLPAIEPLPDPNIPRTFSGYTVHTAQGDSSSIIESDFEEHGLRIFEVGVFLQDAHRFAVVANDEVACLEVLNWPRACRGVDTRVFGNAHEHHLYPRIRRGSAHERTNQTASTETKASHQHATTQSCPIKN